ncbi:aldehyde dehydrogenase family protein [Gordonia amarae]|uniref:Aldehyde dehydrogenase family protein n=2 Tax=Gordonia amarae TaxID=36821 RepID=A0A857LNP1_9ACTN|nr:NAD-dependent succinate-semialdehyde dehydrogenase [Gordonia amarae]MCS3878978.1 succinate-semialdehyde dehydrogenase/glutarate-semialdehyde dehydrogenase [Gordonia amarae]QHN17524.1 aldehyde dehydrogenase family protein [Gordonia amarae]QHN22050.1 aldehyde dehydrogenase family protein [Gordonia amarae]QHN30931.1 aldehyde dehydrogenase family protein [Gordonia amarae]QHN39677.1 aldehyde dehydrogenase family protein [Gordonia amarae]
MTVTSPAPAAIAALHTGLYIDGRWGPAASGATFAVTNPATGALLTHVADGGIDDARRALDSASRQQARWAATPPRTRSEILYRAYDLIVERADEIAAVMTAEMGKPLAEARGEVAYGAEFFRWFAEEAVRIGGDHTTTGDGANRIVVSKQPVGPCILITPWNFPLAMGTRKIGPAIAAGCTMVFKPAELTPLTALLLAAILAEAGLPDGVLNMVTTSDPAAVVGEWMSSGAARKVSFTGSTEVGKTLLRQAAGTVMRTSMELGGNAPFIVCADADLDRAVDGLMVAKMRNMGQACTAANRIFVHRNVIDEFTGKLAEQMKALVVGDGSVAGTQVGPLVEAAAVDKVTTLVDDALGRGARVMTGGVRPDGPGHFYPPTVLTDVHPDSELMRTEIFGPVAALTPFGSTESDGIDEVLTLANDTPWGLVGYAYTQDVDRADRLSDALQVGMVGINTGLVSNPAAPFGGVKESGLGREGGRLGIEEFLDVKYVARPIRGAAG